MTIKLVKTKKDHKEALKRMEEIWHDDSNAEHDNELEVLSVLIEKYENDNFAILAPDPIEAIKFRMEQMNYKKKDLAKVIGANRVSEIFQKKRSLSLGMIRSLHDFLHIPMDSLVK